MRKILILNYEFPPLGGGAGNATYYLLKEYAQHTDYSVDLVTSSTDTARVEAFSKNITIHYLDISKRNSAVHSQSAFNIFTYTYKALIYCRKLKKTKGFDLIHAFFGLPCGAIALLLRTPYIVSLRGSDVPGYNNRFALFDYCISKWLSPIVWKRARRVVSNSEDLRALAHHSSNTTPIDIIYNGVNTTEFYPHKKDNDVFTIVSSSRLTHRKGIEYLIEAFIRFNQTAPNSQLLIVGEGDLKHVLEAHVLSTPRQKNIIFMGAKTHNEMPEIYRTGDVFVLPSMYEGMSNSLLEAMASGLAIVATQTGGIKNILGTHYLAVERKSSSDIEKALTTLYTNKILLKTLKEESRKHALALDWKSVANEYMRYYVEKTS